MKEILKSSFKVSFDYIVSIMIFVVFLMPFYGVLKVYTSVIFIIMFSIVYSDMHNLAVKEKRLGSSPPSFPMKGLLYGVIGFIPFLLIIIIYPFVNINTTFFIFENVKHLAINTLFAPMYILIRAGNESLSAYFAVWFIVPCIAALGYLSGYYGFKLSFYFKKALNKNDEVQKR